MAAKACILLLEDNPTELKTFEMKAKKYLDPGDIIFTAMNGQQAIDVIRSTEDKPDRPCIFILDLNMPGEVKGFDVLRWIRLQIEFTCCPVIILTTSDDPKDRERSFELGATRFYTKPKTNLETGVLLKQILEEFRSCTPGNPYTDSMEQRLKKANG